MIAALTPFGDHPTRADTAASPNCLPHRGVANSGRAVLLELTRWRVAPPHAGCGSRHCHDIRLGPRGGLARAHACADLAPLAAVLAVHPCHSTIPVARPAQRQQRDPRPIGPSSFLIVFRLVFRYGRLPSPTEIRSWA